MHILAPAALIIWVFLLFFRGGFWRVSIPHAYEGRAAASVVAVIPARDEAQNIVETLRSLLNQHYESGLHIVLVDDHSSDDTAGIARHFAESSGAAERLTIVTGSDLPPGWTGKLWAVHQGLAEARKRNPDFVLLTDADITHAPDNVKQLVLRAQAQDLDLASLMVKLHCETLPEKALIPAFVFFFFMLYPPQWITDRQAVTAAAAGGCMLVRPRALDRIGGIEAIRGALIDDCTLAAAIKRSGGSIRLDVTDTTFSTRIYGNFEEIRSMIARTAFTQLHYSWLLLAVVLSGLFATFIAPPLLFFFAHGFAQMAGLAAWLAMAFTFQPTLKLYGRNWAWGFALPAIALFYAAATLGSAIDYARGKGGQWKGRAQAGRG